MATSAKISAIKAVILKVINGHNTYGSSFNPGAIDIFPFRSDSTKLTQLQAKLDEIATKHNESIPLITAARDEWNAMVPDDPLPTGGGTPSPNGFKGTTVVAPDGATWTINFSVPHPTMPDHFQVLRDAVATGNFGVEFEIWNSEVWLRTPPSHWHVWRNNSFIYIGELDPSGVTTPPPPPGGPVEPTQQPFSLTRDEFTPESPSGWVVDLADQNRHPTVVVKLDRVEVARMVANMPSPEVLQANSAWGNGNNRFAFPPFGPGISSGWHELMLVEAYTGAELATKHFHVGPMESVPALNIPVTTDSLRDNHTEEELENGVGTVPGLITYVKPDFFIGGQTQLGERVEQVKRFPEFGNAMFALMNSNGFDHPDPNDRTPFPSQSILNVRIPLPASVLNEAWMSTTFIIEDDTGFTDVGLKLSGFEGRAGGWGGLSCRMEYLSPWMNRELVSYEYRPDTGAGFGIGEMTDTHDRIASGPGNANTCELRVKLNTPKNPAAPDGSIAGWNADGQREIWINNKRVTLRTNVLWQIDPTDGLVYLYCQFFHGGGLKPKTPIRIWVGPYTVTTPGVRAGCIKHTLPTVQTKPTDPLWLQEMAGRQIFSINPIEGTQNWQDNGAAGLYNYSGFANDATPGSMEQRGFGDGGHNVGSATNASTAIDFKQDRPSFRTTHPGSSGDILAAEVAISFKQAGRYTGTCRASLAVVRWCRSARTTTQCSRSSASSTSACALAA
jgi:hypothetical protein